MTLTLDLPSIFLSVDETNNTVRLTDKQTSASKAMSLSDFTKLVKLGIRANVGELP